MNKNNTRLHLSLFLFSLFFLFTPFSLHAAPSWTSVDQLIKQQKFSIADKQLSEILKQAKTNKDASEWTRALVERTKFKMGRNELENAVIFLQQEEWPDDQKSQVILSLFHAKALSEYIQRYSWGIRQREPIESKTSKTKTALKKMTLEQLMREANQAYETAWNGKESWRDQGSKLNSDEYSYFFKAGTYPQRIRGTFRDTLTYLWADFLGDESLWSASHSNQTMTESIEPLLGNDSDNPMSLIPLISVKMSDSKLHPVKRIGWLLSDLERWHQQNNRPEAALEAARVHISGLYQRVNTKPHRVVLLQLLRERIEKEASLPWSTMASWSLANMLQNTGYADSLIQSKAVLDKCLTNHANSSGSKRCKSLLEDILEPEFQVQAMRSDGVQKRSILIEHKNLNRLYFRAWKVDLSEYQKHSNHHQDELITPLLSQSKADVSWSKELPETVDYQLHRSYVTPPMKQLGYWLVVASDNPSFDKSNATMSAFRFNITRLVAEVSKGVNKKKNKLEVTVYQGESGQLAANVDVELWQKNYGKANQRLTVVKTNKEGRVELPVKDHANYFILLSYNEKNRKNNKDSTWLDDVYNYPEYEQGHTKSSLIFTDRSIYRPDHKVQWKVVVYQGDSLKSNYRVMANAKGWIELRDTHGKVVIKKSITTNAYGSASGEFTLKPGFMLGQWSLSTSWNGHKSIRVEEYKRPTFAVEFNDSDSELRLNQKANITGTAKYLFGQAVTEGKVKWSVTRTSGFSRFSPYGGHSYSRHRSYRGYSEPEALEIGTTEINKEGEFTVSFLPTPDMDLQSESPIYSFQVKAEVTDSGGETRTTERTFRMGAISIETNIQAEYPFVVEGDHYELELFRADLNGVPREGDAFWTLNAIQQPSKPILSVDIPLEIDKDKLRYATPGDKLRVRWHGDEADEANGWKVTPWDNWKAGKSLSHGTLSHDKEGKAKIKLSDLKAGLYRLNYTTKDSAGKRFETQKNLMVVSTGDNEIQTPSLLKAKTKLVNAGEKLELLVGSGFKELPVILDVYHGKKRIKHHIIRGGIRRLMFPVLKEHEGGLTFVMSAVKDYQPISQILTISVPKTDRVLDVSFSTFRDKLLPGQKEKWRITVKDSDGKPLAKGAAEVLASMYDKSLDFFTKHSTFDIASLYPEMHYFYRPKTTQNFTHTVWQHERDNMTKVGYKAFEETSLANYERQMRRFMRMESKMAMRVRGASPAPVMAPSAKAGASADDVAEADTESSHSHPPVPNCTKSVTHSHRYTSASHQHKYSCRGAKGGAKRKGVDVYALQRKLKATGEYTGPISGAVSSATRAALKKYMERTGDDQFEGLLEEPTPVVVRTNFNETAFFYPNLILEEEGSVSFEFEVPESLTEWNVWVSALTKDMRGGSISKQVRTSKDLVVRPYLPRFLREGDQAEIEVVISNSGDKPLSGQLDFEVFDPDTGKSRADEFQLEKPQRAFDIQPSRSTYLSFTLSTPKKPGLIAIRVKAQTGKLSDGEQRPLAILPSRIHLAQSKFVTLTDKDSKTLLFNDLANNKDATRINDKLVVTVEGQLFYSALNALPYLTDYPYQCTEQTLNRYLSTAIVKSVFDQHPAVASMAKKLSKRDTKYDKWNEKDANRSMLLEETPWLVESEGGGQAVEKLFRILDPAVATELRNTSLEKLRKAQTASGGFPWWPGGPASEYSTLYLLSGFARALEFNPASKTGVSTGISKDMVKRAWLYLHNEAKGSLKKLDKSRDLPQVTFTNFVLSTYPDVSWTGGVYTKKERQAMLAFSFKYWHDLSPLLRSFLALTLQREGRHQDAKLVFDSVMDSAKTDPQLGTYWAPEDRSWLWYNDRIETHAFILRALMELNPKDSRRHGIVQWLMLDKKLNHWKSTRATAESIYALVHYLKQENQLGIEEKASLSIGTSINKELIFKPDEYTGHNNQTVVQGDDIKPDMAKITVEKDSKGLMFASATWHYSTEKLPKQAKGDFFHVTRKFYKRIQKDKKWTLQPLAEGAVINVGDQLEVQLSLRAKHNAEYIHLRSPRGAGFEPMSNASEYKWDLGIGYYEEIRDSGANYFFEYLPAGEYSFKYRLRATTAGQFRTSPAVVQSIYAPEFVAYSTGKKILIK